MRSTPYVCMVCGQTEQLYYDPDLEIEYYSDDEEHNVLEFWLHEFEFPTCKMAFRACGECSKSPSAKLFELYQARVRAGEIAFFH